MIKNIQILRAWASIVVVFYHTLGMSKSYGQQAEYLSFFGSWGVHGVDIFFVISGFIMYYTQSVKLAQPFKFLKDRIIRIVPIYWLLSIFYLSLFFVVPSLFREFQPDFSYILSSFFFISGFLYGEHPILSYGWTLEYEFIFYMCFFISIFFGKKYYLLISSFLLFLFYYFSPSVNPILIEFIMGMILAYLFLNFDYVNKNLFYLGCLLLIFSIFWDVNDSNRLFFYGLSSVFIVYGCLGVREIKSKLLFFLGSASYSIYLIHVFTLPVFFKISSKYLNFFNNDFLVILSIIFTIFFGSIFYILVEKPITNFLKLRFG